MDSFFSGYKIGDDPEKMDLDVICSLLHNSYWAADRPREVILKSMENSLCFRGVESRNDVSSGDCEDPCLSAHHPAGQRNGEFRFSVKRTVAAQSDGFPLRVLLRIGDGHYG